MTSDGAAYFPETLAGRSDVALTKSHSYSVDRTVRSVTIPGRVNQPTDEFLLTEVGNGSKDALGALFRRHRCPVLNVARRILRDDSEAEDLCQEVFLFLFQNAKAFDPRKGTALSWIIQITYHRAMNRRQYLTFRQHYTAQELNEEQVDPRRDCLFIDEITARTLLNRVREQLSAEQRQTLELHFFEGYTLREIAERTHQTLGNQGITSIEGWTASLLCAPTEGCLSERMGADSLKHAAEPVNPQFHDEFVALCALFYSGEISEEDWALLQIHMAYCDSCHDRFLEYQKLTADVIPAMAGAAAAELDKAPAESANSLEAAERRLMRQVDSMPAKQEEGRTVGSRIGHWPLR